MESWITFNTQSKITLFYNLHMVESLPPPEWFTQRNKFEIIFLAQGGGASLTSFDLWVVISAGRTWVLTSDVK